MDVEAAHLEELRVARRLDDPRRVMPVVPAGCRRVLDIGCGAGQTLIGADVDGGVMACGVDRDVAALQLGRRLARDGAVATVVDAVGGILFFRFAALPPT